MASNRGAQPRNLQHSPARGFVFVAVLAALAAFGIASEPPEAAHANDIPSDLVVYADDSGATITFTRNCPGGYANYAVRIAGTLYGTNVNCSASTVTINASDIGGYSYTYDGFKSATVEINQDFSFTPQNYFEKLSAPTSGNVYGAGLTTLQVSWSEVSGSETRLTYKQDSSLPNPPCNGFQTGGNNPYTLTGLSNSTKYFVFACSAKKGFVNSDWVLLGSGTTLSPKPVLGTVEAKDQSVEVNWTNPSNNTVSVIVSPNPGGSPYSTGTSSNGKYTVTGLNNGTTYTFRVQAGGFTSDSQKSAIPVRDLSLSNFSVLSTTDPDVTGTSKVYDQSTTLKTETFTGTVSGSTVTSDDGTSSFDLDLTESGDGGGTADTDLEFSWTLSYQDKNVGQGKAVEFSNISITGGDDQAEWNLTTKSGDSTSSLAEITPKPLNLVFAIADKTYDGTVGADNLGNNPFSDDRIAGDVLTFGWTAEFSDKNVADNKLVSITDITISGGADQNNYDLQDTSGTTRASISKRDLTLTNFSAEDKIYDGTTDVPVGTFDDDRVAGDILEFDFTAAFANKDVKNNETVNFTGISLSGGADQGNYNLVTTSDSGTANIVERPVHLSGTRVYDATRLIEAADVAITARDVADTGLVGEETLVVEGAGWIESKNVGADLTLEFTAPGEDDPVEGAIGFTLTDGDNGGEASNYTLVDGDHSVTITQAPVTIEGMAGVERIYDGTPTVELEGGALVGIFDGDTVSMANNQEGEADSPDVGDHNVTTEITLVGQDAPNYLLTQPVPTVEITTRELTVTGLRVIPRIYDGSTRAFLTGGTLNNIAPAGSAVSLTGGTTGIFASPNAGTQAVSVTLGLAGANGENYTLIPPAPLSGTIQPAPADIRFISGLVWIEGMSGQPRVATVPAGLPTEVVFDDGAAPTTPGEYLVRASITDPNYTANPVSATLTVLSLEIGEGVIGTPTIGPVLLTGLFGPDSTGGISAGDNGNQFGGLSSGQLLVSLGGSLVPAASVDTLSESSVRINGGDFTIDLEAENADEQPRELNAQGLLELEQGTWVRVSGSGFTPGESAEAWLFSDPQFLGAVEIDASGNFSARLPVPANIEPGVHTIQLNALDSDGQVQSASLGVDVVTAVIPESVTPGSGGESDDSNGSSLIASLGSGLWLLAGFAIVATVAVGGLWWWFVLAGRRRRGREEVYVPELFEIDTRVDSEYRQ